MTEDRGLLACERVAEQTDTIVLKFSGGKDSVASWLRCRAFFPHILPIYHYWCPDLAFVERTLQMYEAFFGQPIIRAPHPNFLNFQATGAYQTPHRLNVCTAYNLASSDYDDIVRFVAEDAGLLNPWVAMGLKTFDSPIRAKAIAAHGAWTPANRFFYPVADWKHRDVYAFLQAHQCPLSQDYADFGRSYDGFQYRYLVVIRDKYPEDYARIKAWFPLVDAELMRAQAYATERE